MRHRHTASFGKRQEYIAVGELLRRGFDVYMTLVDDQQIDCILRQENEITGKLRYLDIQIKARSMDAKHGATFAAIRVHKPRKNFWFIFYSEVTGPKGTYWVMSSMDLVQEANINKGGVDKKGKNLGKCTIKLANKNKNGWKPRPRFQKYENAFYLLEPV